MRLIQSIHWLLFSIFWMTSITTEAAETVSNKPTANIVPYLVQPGDILDIMVWKEEQLQTETMVRPDGYLSFPLAGEILVKGKSFPEIEALLTERLKTYIPDLIITISAKQLLSNTVFVMGKVNKPGEYPLTRPADVTQALAMAGGVSPFAEINEIKVLRRDAYGNQRVLPFRYGDIEDGVDLKQNILLQPGDSVIVP